MLKHASLGAHPVGELLVEARQTTPRETEWNCRKDQIEERVVHSAGKGLRRSLQAASYHSPWWPVHKSGSNKFANSTFTEFASQSFSCPKPPTQTGTWDFSPLRWICAVKTATIKKDVFGRRWQVFHGRMDCIAPSLQTKQFWVSSYVAILLRPFFHKGSEHLAEANIWGSNIPSQVTGAYLRPRCTLTKTCKDWKLVSHFCGGKVWFHYLTAFQTGLISADNSKLASNCCQAPSSLGASCQNHGVPTTITYPLKTSEINISLLLAILFLWKLISWFLRLLHLFGLRLLRLHLQVWYVNFDKALSKLTFCSVYMNGFRILWVWFQSSKMFKAQYWKKRLQAQMSSVITDDKNVGIPQDQQGIWNQRPHGILYSGLWNLW